MQIVETNQYYKAIPALAPWQQVGVSTAWNQVPISSLFQRYIYRNEINQYLRLRPKDYNPTVVVQQGFTGASLGRGLTPWPLAQANSQVTQNQAQNASNAIVNKLLMNANPNPSYY